MVRSEMGRILIVDDNEDLAANMAEMFEEEGLDTVLAHDVESGHARMASGGVDLMITDVRLPDGNGLELLESAKTSNPAMPVVVISGYPDPDTTRRALELGAVAVSAKPFEMIEFFRMCTKLAVETEGK
jgi:two-component system response regulator HydG